MPSCRVSAPPVSGPAPTVPGLQLRDFGHERSWADRPLSCSHPSPSAALPCSPSGLDSGLPHLTRSH